MINFFRKIRQRLLAENKIGKYLAYAVGEIVLVVIGILIALAINSWNQDRLDVKKESKILNNLVTDLEEQSLALEEYIIEETGYYESGIYIADHYSRNKGCSQ